MKSRFTTILRLVLGLGLVLFGVNQLFRFVPLFDMPVAAVNFIQSLESTGYLFYVVAILEIFIGLLLLINKWVPFALVLLAPIALNILLFHIFLDVSDILIAIILVVLNVLLIYKYWKAYKPLFQY